MTIPENIILLQQTKDKIKGALEKKGISTEGLTFLEYADKVANLSDQSINIYNIGSGTFNPAMMDFSHYNPGDVVLVIADANAAEFKGDVIA